MNEPILTVNESILLLKADVKVLQQGQDRNYNSLKESQDKFHVEMKESFKELKNDYSGRLNLVEENVKSLRESRDTINGGLKWAGIVLGVLITVIGWVYISHRADDATYQAAQDSRIDNLTKQVNHISQ